MHPNRVKKWSPSERVPVLREERTADSSLVVWDSLSIFDYLIERFPDATSFAWPTNPGRSFTCTLLHGSTTSKA
jgi:glutathione S-transferase